MVRRLSIRAARLMVLLAWASFPLISGYGAYVLGSASGSATGWILMAGILIGAAGLMRLPIGYELSAGYAVVAALPLVADGSGHIFDIPGQFAAVFVGLTVLWIVRSTRGDRQAAVFGSSVRRAAGFSTFVLISGALGRAAFPSAMSGWQEVFVFLGSAALTFGVELGLSRASWRMSSSTVGQSVPIDGSDLAEFVTLTAAGTLFGLTFDVVGWWALAVSLLPYAFAHGAFRRFRAAKVTYAQMIRALGRLPEAAGHSPVGHAERCGDLAREVGIGFGLSFRDLERLEYAALLHDIGRISLTEPAVVRRGYTDAEIGAWGAEIISEARYLKPVAEIVSRHHEPFRNPGEARDEALPLACRIVRTVSAFDDALADTGSSLEAMEHLHRGSAYEFDPAVTAALRAVIERRGSARTR